MIKPDTLRVTDADSLSIPNKKLLNTCKKEKKELRYNLLCNALQYYVVWMTVQRTRQRGG